MSIEVFISHSHNDKDVAERLVEFLIDGVDLNPNEIRCTSVRATSLKSGTNVNTQLRKEIDDCRIFIPLISTNTARSEYVLFEIGAAWALEKTIFPLLLTKTDLKLLPALLQGHVSRSLSDLQELEQLGIDIASETYLAGSRVDLVKTKIPAAAKAFKMKP